MRRAVSKVSSKSPDPIKAYKARIEVRIYTMLLDLIAKEIEAEELKGEPVKKGKPSKTTATETRTQAEVQVA